MSNSDEIVLEKEIINNEVVLTGKANEVINNTKEALQTVYDSLNNGQKKQIIKVEKVKELFDRYHVEYNE